MGGVTLNFKEIYKSANDSLHADKSIINDMFSEESRKNRFPFGQLTLYATAAVLLLVVGFSYFNITKDNGVTVVEKKVESTLIFKTIGDISALLRQENQRILAFNVDKCIRPIQLEKNRLVCSLTEEAPRDLVAQLDRFLSAKTGCPFEIVVEENGGGQTAQEAAVAQKQQELSDLQKNPMVSAILNTFKGSKIESFKKNKASLTTESDSSEEDGE